MAKRKKEITVAVSSDHPSYQALLDGITDIITRPDLNQISTKQAFDILWAFRERFLSEEERKLPSAEKQQLWQERVATLKLSGHDPALDELFVTLARPARDFASDAIHADTKVNTALNAQESLVLAMAWTTLENAKRNGNATVQQVAENLHQAIYAVVPPKKGPKITSAVGWPLTR